MFVKKWILSTLAVLLLVGCATVIPYNQKAMSLQIGMTKQEVVSLLGNPKKAELRVRDVEKENYTLPLMSFKISQSELELAYKPLYLLQKNKKTQ